MSSIFRGMVFCTLEITVSVESGVIPHRLVLERGMAGVLRVRE